MEKILHKRSPWTHETAHYGWGYCMYWIDEGQEDNEFTNSEEEITCPECKSVLLIEKKKLLDSY